MVLAWDWYVAVCLVGLGAASFMFHRTKRQDWQTADLTMIYCVLLALVAYLSGWDWAPAAAFLGTAAPVIFWKWKPTHLSIGILGAVILFMMIVTGHSHIPLTVLFFGLWGLFNIPWLKLDWPHTWLDASHSLTHIFAALGIYQIIIGG